MYRNVPADVPPLTNFQVDQSVASFEMHFKTYYKMLQLFLNVPHSKYMYHDVPADFHLLTNFGVDQSGASFEMHFKKCYTYFRMYLVDS